MPKPKAKNQKLQRGSLQTGRVSDGKVRAADFCGSSVVKEETALFKPSRLALRQWTTLDLFCGAGGITEGFRQAGFECVYANDINRWAIETFRANHPTTLADNRAIEQVDPALLRSELGLSKGDLDVLVGGPPCQGFSINAPDRFLDDPRNSLFRHYVRFLAEFEPKAILFENVPGMLSLEGGVVFERIVEALRAYGYDVSVKILFAAHYGVPQERWRTIILGHAMA